MKGKYLGIIGFLSMLIMLIASCELIPPECALAVINRSYASIGGGNIRISFQLENTGSESLQNCKVRWFVDDFDGDASDADVEFNTVNDITVWAPAMGVDLSVGEISGIITVDTTSGLYGGGVNFYGVYEYGFDNPPDE